MAGSNELTKRTLTGAVLILILILFLWLDHIVLPIFLLFLITFASNEYLRFWKLKNIYPDNIALLLPIYLIIFCAYFEVPLLLPAFILFFVVCFFALLRFAKSHQRSDFITEVSATLMGVIYLSVLPISIILLRKMAFRICLIPFILTWLYDTFAYIVGSAIGKHRLAEKISPKKSWEGTILAFPLTLPFAFFLNKTWLPQLNFIDTIIMTLGIAILGTVGDLFESAMKREVGLKDTSNIFPGHGGFLDRIDSLIFNVPFFYLYIILRA